MPRANKTSYAYDGFDRLSKTSYPDTAKGAGTSSSTDYEALVYDAGSNVTSLHLRGYAGDSQQAYRLQLRRSQSHHRQGPAGVPSPTSPMPTTCSAG